MEENILFDTGGQLQIGRKGNTLVLVPFPVCLAIKHENNLIETCPNFILNMDESWIFIRSGSPLPEGTSLILHFYIPPEIKLLAEVWGKVVPIVSSGMLLPSGMLIRFAYFSRWHLKYLERYVKGERHLVDRAA